MNTDDAFPPVAMEGSDGPASRSDVNQPLAQAARSLQEINRPFLIPGPNPSGLDDLAAALQHSLDAGGDTEAMLYTQARILDALFKRMVMHDIHGPYTDKNGIAHMRDEKLAFALRSQRQSRMAIATLTTMRRRKDGAQDK